MFFKKIMDKFFRRMILHYKSIIFKSILFTLSFITLEANTVTINNVSTINVWGNITTTVDSDISFAGTTSYSNGYLEYSLDSADSTDTFGINVDSNNILNGAISVIGSVIYQGNGIGVDKIGTIDSIRNGQNGQPLRINFNASLISNSDFELGNTTGWSITNTRYPNNVTLLDGQLIPIDVDDLSVDSNGDGYGTINVAQENSMSYASEVTSLEKHSGNYALRLYNSGNISFTNLTNSESNYGSIHGPYVNSTDFHANMGDSLSFYWKAANGGDWYEVLGYLKNVDTGVRTLIFSQRGALQDWTLAAISVPVTGNYQFEFVCGTYDASGGYAVGASLYIDDITILNFAIDDTIVTNIARHINYKSETIISSSRDLNISVKTTDGILSTVTTTLTVLLDTDGDGIENNTDTDDDNDGVLDVSDAFPLDENESVDTDNDGTGNNTDLDDDNDGTLDMSDAFPLDENESTDTDNDGIGNNADLDDDNDGISDILELAYELDPLDPSDADEDNDGDGISNRDEINAGSNINESNLVKAQIKGNLINASVKIFQIEEDGNTTFLFEENTDIEGEFDGHGLSLDSEKFYIYEVSGGVDANNSFINHGTIRAIVKGSSIQLNAFTVSVASEILYLLSVKEIKYTYDVSTLQTTLDNNSKIIFDADIDGNGYINSNDSLHFEYSRDKDKLNSFRYNTIDNMLIDIYDNNILSFTDEVNMNRFKSFDFDGNITYARNIILSSDNQKAYLLDRSLGFSILDISNSSNPSILASLNIGINLEKIILSHDGTIAYISDTYTGLHIVDISNPLHPILLGSYDDMNANADSRTNDIALSPDGRKIYVVGHEYTEELLDNGYTSSTWDYSNGLKVISVSNSASPSLLGTFNTQGSPNGIAVSPDGTKVYVANYVHGIQIMNVTNPASIVFLTPDDVATADAHGDDIVLSNDGTKAFYTTQGASGISIKDITDPSNIISLPSYNLAGNVFILSDDSTKLYATSSNMAGDEKLTVYDVSDTSINPVRIMSYAIIENTSAIELSSDGTKIYLINNVELQVIDISNPPSALLQSYDINYTVRNVAVSNDEKKAYIATYDGGLKIIDTTDPIHPSLLKTYVANYVYDVVLSNDETKAYIAAGSNGLQIIDITNPDSVLLLGTYDYDTGNGATNVSLSDDGSTIYLGVYNQLYIIDISDPSNLSLLGTYDSDGYVKSTTLSSDGTKVYIASDSRGVEVLDITNPALPFLIKQFYTGGDTEDIKLSNDETKLYVISSNYFSHGNFKVIDISNLDTPLNLGSFTLQGNAYSLDISNDGNRVYVADDYFGMKVIDISNSSFPSLLISLPVGGRLNSVTLSATNAKAYLGNSNGLQIIDLEISHSIVESDIDSDGVIDRKDAFPTDPNESLDNDMDHIGDNADLDDDNDGMLDDYEIANGLDSLDASDAIIDSDSDGYTNLEEYTAGTDPQDASSNIFSLSIIGTTKYFSQSAGTKGVRIFADDNTYIGSLTLSDGTIFSVDGIYEINRNVLTINRINPSEATLELTYLGENNRVIHFDLSTGSIENIESFFYETEAERDASLDKINLNPSLILYILN